MGVCFTVHCGPAVKIPEGIGVSTDEVYETCPNEDCIRHGKNVNTPFCPNCGSKAVGAKKKVKKKLKFSDFLDDYDHWDEFWVQETGDCESWGLPNHSIPGCYSYEMGYDSEPREMNLEEMEESVKAFKERYKKILKDMEEYYAMKIEVKYIIGGFYS